MVASVVVVVVGVTPCHKLDASKYTIDKAATFKVMYDTEIYSHHLNWFVILSNIMYTLENKFCNVICLNNLVVACNAIDVSSLK